MVLPDNISSPADATGTVSGRSAVRTHLILARASNLPTVWSNCLAGWLLAGGGGIVGLVFLCLGATCLYIGGMYLNDAFDLDFDLQHRKERPIPSGAMTVASVWSWGFGWLGAGLILLLGFGGSTATFACLLLICIVLYDVIHKAITLSPVIMALCRVLLYLVAGSVGLYHATGLVVWSALVLGLYIGGLSYVAKTESTRGAMKYWPCYLLASPLLLAWLANSGAHRGAATLFSLVLLVWTLLALRHTFGLPEVRNPGRTVSALLAGIVLVDLVAVAPLRPGIAFAFILLFVSALIFQRFIPAT